MCDGVVGRAGLEPAHPGGTAFTERLSSSISDADPQVRRCSQTIGRIVQRNIVLTLNLHSWADLLRLVLGRSMSGRGALRHRPTGVRHSAECGRATAMRGSGACASQERPVSFRSPAWSARVRVWSNF